MKLDHIAIVTDQLENTIRTFEDLLGVKADPPVSVPDQGVISAYIPLEGVGIELMQPTDPDGGIQKFLDKRGPGIHHVAVRLDDRKAALDTYREAGVRLIIGTANGSQSAFIHPKSTGGVLIELCGGDKKEE